LEQRKRRVGVDGVVEADHRLQPFQIDGTIDVDAPPRSAIL